MRRLIEETVIANFRRGFDEVAIAKNLDMEDITRLEKERFQIRKYVRKLSDLSLLRALTAQHRQEFR